MAALLFPLGRWLHPPAAEASGTAMERNTRTGPKRERKETLGRGAADLLDWQLRVDVTGRGDFVTLAGILAGDPRGGDMAFWRHLLGRWSAEDGRGMVAWIRQSAPPSSRDKILEMACFAWGTSAPDAAMEGASFLPQRCCERIMWGMAEVDLKKTVEFVLKMPRQQEGIAAILPTLMAKEPALADTLRKRSVYDSSRKVAERADCERLAAADPAAAIELARGHGVIGYDPVPAVIQTIANRDPSRGRQANRCDAWQQDESLVLHQTGESLGAE